MSELERLKRICTDNGICVKCGNHWEHHLDEPFASCSCGTGEDTKLGSPYMQLQKKCYDLYLENKDLKERLIRL